MRLRRTSNFEVNYSVHGTRIILMALVYMLSMWREMDGSGTGALREEHVGPSVVVVLFSPPAIDKFLHVGFRDE